MRAATSRVVPVSRALIQKKLGDDLKSVCAELRF